MDVLVAALPILATLGLLPARLPAWVAPAVGLVTALLAGLLYFATPLGEVGAVFAGGTPTVIEVLAIIGGGILLARVMDRTGAQSRIAGWLSAGGGPTVASALLMVNGVVPFLESVTGFGVSLIIGIPLLLALGFRPMLAVLLSLLGLTIAPWGSMAPGTLLGSQIAGVPLLDLGLTSGAFTALSFLGGSTIAAVLAGRYGRSAGQRTWRDHARWIGVGLTAGLIQSAFVLSANLLLGTAVAGASASLVMSGLWAMVISRGRMLPTPWRPLAPYLILLLGTIAGQVLERTVLPTVAGMVIGSPALWSITGAVAGVYILAMQGHHRAALPREAGRLWIGTAVPTALYLLLGFAVSGGGLADTLAEALVALGPVYVFLMPWVGGLSGYITASNTGANAMFGATQVAAGHGLGLDPVWVMGAQNAAAGLGCMTSPARIELAYQLGTQAAKDAAEAEDAAAGDAAGGDAAAAGAGPDAARTAGGAVPDVVTRGKILRVTLPFFLGCLLVWAVASVLWLPTV